MSAEATNNWIIYYRGFPAADYACEMAKLQKWLNNPYESQNQGSKSYARAREGILAQAAALQRVINERSGAPCVGVMDASGGIWGVAVPTGQCGYPNSWN